MERGVVRPAGALALVVMLTALVACGDRAATSPEQLAKDHGAIDTKGADSSKTKSDSAAPKADTGGTKPDTGGTKPDTGATDPDTAGGTDPDTAGGERPDTSVTVGPDTTRDDAFIRGTVVGVDSSAALPTPKGVKGVVVTAFRRVVNQTSGSRDSGTVSYDSVAAMETNGAGAFDFKGLRGGYYQLRAVPPAGSGWPTVTGYPAVAWSIRDLVLTHPLVIYLHKR